MKDDEQLKSKAHEYVLNHYDSSGYGTVQMVLEENAYMAGYKVAVVEILELVKELSDKGVREINDSLDCADWTECNIWEGYVRCTKELLKKLSNA